MTNRYIHCPFCANNLDFSYDGKLEHVSNRTEAFIGYCKNCDSYFTLISDDLREKAHRGPCKDITEPCKMEGLG